MYKKHIEMMNKLGAYDFDSGFDEDQSKLWDEIQALLRAAEPQDAAAEREHCYCVACDWAEEHGADLGGPCPTSLVEREREAARLQWRIAELEKLTTHLKSMVDEHAQVEADCVSEGILTGRAQERSKCIANVRVAMTVDPDGLERLRAHLHGKERERIEDALRQATGGAQLGYPLAKAIVDLIEREIATAYQSGTEIDWD